MNDKNNLVKLDLVHIKETLTICSTKSGLIKRNLDILILFFKN